MIQDAIRMAVERKNLPVESAQEVMREMMRGTATQSQIGSFLTAMRMKGETEDELRGFVTAMRESSSRIVAPPGAVDMCGTGGDGAETFNISTVASFVVASTGVSVAKHGNRSVSSKCGSADLLGAMGIPYDLPPEMVQESLDACGMGFMFAPVFHRSMKSVIGPRRELGLRTFFNMLGPMTNPAGVKNQLIGVYDPKLSVTIARVLSELGAEHVLVVSGSGTDECTTTGKTQVVDMRNGSIDRYSIEPGMFGLDLAEPGMIRGGGPEENARIAMSVLKGECSPRADIVALNAGAGLYASGKAQSMDDGVCIAKAALSSGRALQKARQFADLSWDLESRRQLTERVESLADRRIHPQVLVQRAHSISHALASEISESDSGQRLLGNVDDSLLSDPNVLTVIVLERIKSILSGSGPDVPSGIRSRVRLSESVASSRGIAVIAEYKSRSPSTGPLAIPPDVQAVSDAYKSAGVSGVSVVVEPRFFGGSYGLLAAFRDRLSLPMLFKDFVVSEEQVEVAERVGADSVLLIAKALRLDALDRLAELCLSKGMEPLVEVHDLLDIEKLTRCSCSGRIRLVGINSRDLRTLKTDLSGLAALRAAIGKDKLTIAESGLSSASDVEMIPGFDAVLIGTAFMRAEDLDSKVGEMVSACRSVPR
jgi:anthranilate phosphoribosyltransferase